MQLTKDGVAQNAPQLAVSGDYVSVYINVSNRNTTKIAKYFVQREESNGTWKTIINSKQGLNKNTIYDFVHLRTVFGDNNSIRYRILIYYQRDKKNYRFYTSAKTLNKPSTSSNNSSSSNKTTSQAKPAKVEKPVIKSFKATTSLTTPAASVTLEGYGTHNGVGIKYYKFSTETSYNGYAFTINNGTCYSVTPTLRQTVTENGTYYLYLIDANGNVTRSSNGIKVSNIDKTAPSISGLKISTTKSAKSIKLYFSGQDNGAGIQAYKVTTSSSYDGNPTNLNGRYKSITNYSETITKNGTYYVYLIDAAGNVSRSNGVKISNIDSVKPYFKSLKYVGTTGKVRSGIAYAKKGQTVTWRVTTNEKVTVDSNKIKLSSAGATDSKVSVKKINDTTYDIILTAGTGNGTLSFNVEEGFLTDVAGNKSKKGSVHSKQYVDNTAPTVTQKVTQSGSKTSVTATLRDNAAGIVSWWWTIGNDKSNPIKTYGKHKCSVRSEINISGNSSYGEQMHLYVEDSIGNVRCVDINPIVDFTVKGTAEKAGKQSLKNIGDTVQYKITSNAKVKLYEPYITNIKIEGTGAAGVKVKEIKATGTSGKEFLLTLECIKEVSGSVKITIPQGTIYFENPHSSNEKSIEINNLVVDNKAPTINAGVIDAEKLVDKSVGTKINYYLADELSGVAKYRLTRIGGGSVTKTLTSKSGYTISYTAKNNGTFKIEVWDTAGNKSEKEVKVNNLVLLGDLNNDEKITQADATILSEYIAGNREEKDERILFAMDMNGDGKIDNTDLTKLNEKIK